MEQIAMRAALEYTSIQDEPEKVYRLGKWRKIETA